MAEIVVGIDASRIRSGGGIAHLIGILKNGNPTKHGIEKVHIWSYKSLLNQLPQASWITIHNPPQLELSLPHQIWWQYHTLPHQVKKTNCNILFTADASSVCNFQPSIVLSQDMQSYEPGLMEQYGLSLKRLRLITIGILQTQSFKRASGVIFLTQYARQIIQKTTGMLDNISVISHGIGEEFRKNPPERAQPDKQNRDIQCIYISNAEIYKHQWVVIKAFGKLRKQGHKTKLLLVGGGKGRARKLMDKAIIETDPLGDFIESREFMPHSEIPKILGASDLCVFASSCENMPVTLLESMAVGLPIACSNRGPMPEVLEDGGVYFNPEDVDSIASSIANIVNDFELRMRIAKRAAELSQKYSWSRCADETWEFIAQTYKNYII